jgi:lipopolysaccharide biosynthesis protein
MWEEIKSCLSNISSSYDLYVTIVEEHQDLQKDILRFNPMANIQIIENRGFDIGPFIHVLNQVNLDNYEYVIKLHTKRDFPKYPCILNTFNISRDRWRKYLLSFCSTPENWSETMSLFENDTSVGMIADAHLIFKFKYDREHATKKNAYRIIEDIGLSISKETFVMGSMFMAKAKLFKVLQNKFNLPDFDVPNRRDINTLAHAIERVFGLLVNSQGMQIRDYNNKLEFFEKTRPIRKIGLFLQILGIIGIIFLLLYSLFNLVL